MQGNTPPEAGCCCDLTMILACSGRKAATQESHTETSARNTHRNLCKEYTSQLRRRSNKCRTQCLARSRDTSIKRISLSIAPGHHQPFLIRCRAFLYISAHCVALMNGAHPLSHLPEYAPFLDSFNKRLTCPDVACPDEGPAGCGGGGGGGVGGGAGK